MEDVPDGDADHEVEDRQSCPIGHPRSCVVCQPGTEEFELREHSCVLGTMRIERGVANPTQDRFFVREVFLDRITEFVEHHRKSVGIRRVAGQPAGFQSQAKDFLMLLVVRLGMPGGKH